MINVADFIVSLLGNGPAVERTIVGRLVGLGMPYDFAADNVKTALTELLMTKQIECVPGANWMVYVLPKTTPMEEDEDQNKVETKRLTANEQWRKALKKT